MSKAGRDLLLQDAFTVGLISSFEDRAKVGCLIWDETPDGVDVEVDPQAVLPETVRLSIASLKIDRPCTVVERAGGRLHLVFLR